MTIQIVRVNNANSLENFSATFQEALSPTKTRFLSECKKIKEVAIRFFKSEYHKVVKVISALILTGVVAGIFGALKSDTAEEVKKETVKWVNEAEWIIVKSYITHSYCPKFIDKLIKNEEKENILIVMAYRVAYLSFLFLL